MIINTEVVVIHEARMKTVTIIMVVKVQHQPGLLQVLFQVDRRGVTMATTPGLSGLQSFFANQGVTFTIQADSHDFQ